MAHEKLFEKPYHEATKGAKKHKVGDQRDAFTCCFAPLSVLSVFVVTFQTVSERQQSVLLTRLETHPCTKG